jgi:ABC-type nitrate/sulfonate/bicarbonate transport system substrate-binding protein
MIGHLVKSLAVLALVVIGAAPSNAADRTIRVGYQKYGTLVLVKAKGNLEKKLERLGFDVAWTEFPSGPPLLEAINVGAIDFGATGETPPIFAQAAGAPFLAWVIWDPFLAAAEVATGARTLTDGTGIVANHQFYLAEQTFAAANPRVIDEVIAAVGEIDAWAKDNASAVAAQLGPALGIPAPILEIALRRQSYGVKALDNAVVAEQQRIADTFATLGLLPKPVVVSAVVRKAGS